MINTTMGKHLTGGRGGIREGFLGEIILKRSGSKVKRGKRKREFLAKGGVSSEAKECDNFEELTKRNVRDMNMVKKGDGANMPNSKQAFHPFPFLSISLLFTV